jgi:hypothetical protein
MVIAISLAVIGGLAPTVYPLNRCIGLSSLLTGSASSIGAIAVQRLPDAQVNKVQILKLCLYPVAIAPAVSNAIAPVISGTLLDHAGFVTTLVVGALIPGCALFACVRVPFETIALPKQRSSIRDALDLLRLSAYRRMLLLNLVTISSWGTPFVCCTSARPCSTTLRDRNWHRPRRLFGGKYCDSGRHRTVGRNALAKKLPCGLRYSWQCWAF